MQLIQETLEASLEDFSISRSERKELKSLLNNIQGDKVQQAKVRELAFQLATRSMEEVGELTAMDWLQGVIKLLYSHEMKIKASAYFSPGDDCLHRIQQMIREAQHSLDICIFTLTDNRITRKLEEAYRRGVKIRIISDDLKSDDLGSDVDQLLRLGLSCRFDRTDAHMHHKFAIADGNLLLTGSYNWTRSASYENNENIILSNHHKLLISFQKEFNRLWKTFQ